MKTFETPKINVLTVATESIMDSNTGNIPTQATTGDNQLPWA